MVCERKEEAAEEEAEEERRDTESKTRTPHKDVVKKTLKFHYRSYQPTFEQGPAKAL